MLLLLALIALPGAWKLMAALPAFVLLGAVLPTRNGGTVAQIPDQVWVLPGQKGRFNQEVVGESFRGKEFGRVMRRVRVTSEGVELVETASLVPEPRNKFDKLAVAVIVKGQTLGYLPREDAAVYQPVLLAATKAGRHAQVSARLYARRDASIPGGTLNSVRVDLAPLDEISATQTE